MLGLNDFQGVINKGSKQVRSKHAYTQYNKTD